MAGWFRRKRLFFRRARPSRLPEEKPPPRDPHRARSRTDPVKVVFVCAYGGTSGIICKNFNELLAKRRIHFVKSSFADALWESIEANKKKSAESLKTELGTADVVVHFFLTGSKAEKKVLAAASKDSVVYAIPEALDTNFEWLLGLVRKNFRFTDTKP